VNEEGRDQIGRQIRAAFRDLPALKPQDVVAAGPDTGERDEIRDAFAPWTWATAPRKTLLNDPGALSFMTPSGFRMFLPAYLLLSLESPDAAGVHLDSVVFLLMPRTGWEAVLQDRLNALSPEQLKAVRDFLAFMRDRHAVDFERRDYNSAIGALEERMALGSESRSK